MSTQTARGLAAGQTDEERIERYLSLNPDFFERHQPLLARMRLPHMRTGSTVSLVERQVEVLREQKTDADRRLAEFIAVARANDHARRTHPSLHAPPAACAKPRSRPSARSKPACVKTSTHFIRCSCSPRRSPRWPTSKLEPFLRKLPADDANIRSFEALLATGKPRCGQVRDTQRDFLFGPESREHRLGGAGAAGRKRHAGPARAGQRRTRAVPSRHEHGIPEAHGRADHGCSLTAVKRSGTDFSLSPRSVNDAPPSDRAPVIDGYLTHLGIERRLSPHTSSNYARDLRALADFMERGNLPDWGKVDSQHVRVFAARSHAGGLSPRSVQRRLSAVRGFFNYLLRERIVASNPARRHPRAQGRPAPARHARRRSAQPAARHPTGRRAGGARQGDHGAVLFIRSAPR